MAITQEQFNELRAELNSGSLSLSFKDFGDEISNGLDFFRNSSIRIREIQILSDEIDRIKFLSSSKNFFFTRRNRRDDSFKYEIEITYENGELELFAICKPNKAFLTFSSIPYLIGDLLKPLDSLKIEDFAFIITSKAITRIDSKSFPIYSSEAVNFLPGINLAGFIDLKNSGDIANLISQPLEPIMGPGPYFMSWNLRDRIDIDFNLLIPRDIKVDNIFQISEPKLKIRPLAPVEFSLDGMFEIELPAIPSIKIEGAFLYGADKIQGNFNLDSIAKELPVPFGVPGVNLNTLTVSAGTLVGTPFVGAEGTFYIGPNKPHNLEDGQLNESFGIKSNEFKIIYTALPGKITPTFAYLYLDEINLELIIEAMTNQDVALPKFLNEISMEQVMFHWCENPLGEKKPDGTIAYPVFGLSSITKILGHKTFTELKFTGDGKSTGKFVADPIDIGNGLLKITGNGQGTPETYKGATTIQPGGMEVSFYSTGIPHYFSFSTKIEVLGITGEANGSINNNGFMAQLKSDIAGILENELKIIYKNQSFEADTIINAGIDGMKISLGSLGNITLNCKLKGAFNAKFNNEELSCSMSLSFDFIGVHFDLGTLTLAIRDLNKIVQELEHFIKEKVIRELAENALAWLTATIEDAIEFVGEKLEEIGRALNKEFEETLEKGAELMRKVGYQAKEVAEALNKGYEASKEELAKALEQAGYLTEEIAEALKDVLGLSGQVVAEILKGVGSSVEEIARTLKLVYDYSEKQIAEVLKKMEASVEEIAKVLKNVLGSSAEIIGEVLSGLSYSSEIISNTLKNIGYEAGKVGDVLVNVLKVPENVAKEILKKIGFKTPDIDIRFPYIKGPYIKSPYIKSPYIKSPYVKW
ncbi:hypothetical protein [Flagellimonas sp.]|uniref:hypothetical protein n=1 Tax=Flagellimonas sp. TaxID=2058762 RepID=UPI003B5194D2